MPARATSGTQASSSAIVFAALVLQIEYQMKKSTFAILLIIGSFPALADAAACRKAREEAVVPLSKSLDADSKLITAASAGCSRDLKRLYVEALALRKEVETALKKVERVCGRSEGSVPASSPEMEALARHCDTRK